MLTVKVSADELSAFKAQWPCHGISDKVHSIAFEFDRTGNLIDIEARARNGRMLDSETYDGAAALALSQDAQRKLQPAFDRLNDFGRLNPHWYQRSFARMSRNGLKVELRYSSDQGTGVIGNVELEPLRFGQ